MRIAPFAVEQWMDAHENECAHNCAETCVDSVTVAELLELAGLPPGELAARLLPLKLTYGHIRGSPEARSAIAALYPGRGPGDVLLTHGAVGANHLLYCALVGPGDEVVALTPNYQQHTAIPEALGAVVKQLPLRREAGYLPDLAALEDLVTPRTRVISYSNPNNPTGSLMDNATQAAILAIAARVYRGVDQEGDALGASAACLDPARGVAVGSMSKAFAMAGVRLGWVVGPPEVLERVMLHRDYSTISVGVVDDALAALALAPAVLGPLLARNRALVRANAARVDAWVARHAPRVSWVRPRGGTVGLLHYRLAAPVGSEELCLRLLREAGVLLVPGSAFGVEGAVRIGIGNSAAALAAGLDAFSRFLDAL
ncbi:MAG: aspartate/tyrosine/aromatic aminotransferase [Monoraphidium minutum]|nr:MAG: aspartate/tyrosine/aromatic aminotransferase [Monoraphidium minutum]